MRRSEAFLLFLFIATAVFYFSLRARSGGTSAAEAAASAVVHAAVPSAGASVSAARPAATPTPMPPPYFSAAWLQAHPPSDVPAITAQGAIVVDRDTQQILFGRNIDTRRPPASIMKVVTAMVALDLAGPKQLIGVSRDAANEEPNRMGLSYGEQLTVGDLLYGLLLDSGNDAADALADGLPGGRAGFVQAMNRKAAALGLLNTHFVDPSGLDDDNYTSPYDMAVLASAALSGYPTIRTVVSTKQASIPATATHKPFAPINLNDLLWDYPGTYGMKVGYTDAAEYTIIAAGQKNGHNLMIVLLGSKRHFTEAKALFDWGYAHAPSPDSSPVRKFPADVEKP